jgi:hypothetical protein
MNKNSEHNLRVAMDMIGIKDTIDVFIDHLIDYTRPIAERECKTKLDNIFINKIDTHKSFNDCIVMRVYWSADNHPRCNKIYANNYRYDISDVLAYYREYKLNKLLCDG